jgi:aspartate carbamoyltransferase
MGLDGPFLGRTIQVVEDLNIDEQIYLYQKTSELKKAWEEGGPLDEFRIASEDVNAYLIFLEDSTRTKESFRNAANFHGIQVNDFDAAHSSFNKKESLSDTIKMLAGYNKRSIFIIRSKSEGTCRHLESFIGDYARSHKRVPPSFINAGDGKHEHPTQEFLDEFSFLEAQDWNRDSIHLVLTGDLFHGRTVHSKAAGLKIFKKVKVDLVAPQEIGLPDYYREMMRNNGFEIRVFGTIEEYLQQEDIAPIWYFTRLQLERMGDQVLNRITALRRAVTFREEFMQKLPKGAKFYHPLPRNRDYPTIPDFLLTTELNGWDDQSVNGFFTRVIEMAMVAGKIGQDYTGVLGKPSREEPPFIIDVPVDVSEKLNKKMAIKLVENGIVIDHIGRGKDPEAIWNLIDKIRRNLGLNFYSAHGVFQSYLTKKNKGLISIPDVLELNGRMEKMLAALAPGSTINHIQNHKVVKKFRLEMPPRVYNFKEIGCSNENCISHESHREPITAEFWKSEGKTFICRYCEKEYEYEDIWLE